MVSRSRAIARSTALASAANGALAGSARVAFTARSTAAWSGISRNRICAAATTSVHSSAPPRLGRPFSNRRASALRIVPSRRSDTVAIERASARSRGSRPPLCIVRSAASRSSSGRAKVNASPTVRAAATRAAIPGGAGAGVSRRPARNPPDCRANPRLEIKIAPAANTASIREI